MTTPTVQTTGQTPGVTRRDELLTIAAQLFAERGFRNTTVRNIADAAGILSGSLYHHFDSKESMVDEILQTFQRALFAAYDEILSSGLPARMKIEAAVRLSFEAIDQHHAEVAIFQNEADWLIGLGDRFAYLTERHAQSRQVWLTLLTEGVESGALKPDIDIELAYRFIRDTVWVAVRWYRPGGELTHERVADQYLSILLDGLAA